MLISKAGNKMTTLLHVQEMNSPAIVKTTVQFINEKNNFTPEMQIPRVHRAVRHLRAI